MQTIKATTKTGEWIYLLAMRWSDKISGRPYHQSRPITAETRVFVRLANGARIDNRPSTVEIWDKRTGFSKA